MFSSALGSVTKHAATVTKHAAKVGGLLNDGLEKAKDTGAGLSANLFTGADLKDDFDIPITCDGPILIKYVMQDDKTEDACAFALPAKSNNPRDTLHVTQAMIRKSFPLRSCEFHFRYKLQMPEDSFGGYVWVDLESDDEKVPLFKNGISMKVLRLPNGLEGSTVAAPQTGPQVSSQVCTSDPFVPGPRREAAVSSPVAASPSRLPAPIDDMMEFAADVPPPPVVMPDRQELVRRREDDKARRIADAKAQNDAQVHKEESMKQEKVSLNNQLSTELDRWARTPDGTAWKDIRTLLSTVHEVMWPDSAWQPVSLADLVAKEGNIKKQYRKAILITHPDRAQGRGAEQQVRADRIFQALNESFKKESGA